jgi:hypothetical protein
VGDLEQLVCLRLIDVPIRRLPPSLVNLRFAIFTLQHLKAYVFAELDMGACCSKFSRIWRDQCEYLVWIDQDGRERTTSSSG